MNLTILTDGGKKFGFGHISRSQTLASHFINNGHETKVLVLSNIDIDNTHFGENIIIDIPYNGDFLLQKIDCNANIIGLDYIGEGELDLVINVHDYSRCKSSNQVSGLEYAIIKEEIIKIQFKVQ